MKDTKRIHPAVVGRTVSIVGIGSYVPDRILTNADLEKMVDTTDEWITTRTGIKERHIAAPDQASSDLGAEAARRALADAGISPEDVDMIVLGTITPDMGFPNTACFVQAKIGARNAFCFDIEAACSGFLYALEIGRQFVSTGTMETVLVIAAEKITSILDWKDRNTCVLFGDAAGAVVLRARGAAHGVMSSVLGSDGTLAELLMLPGGGSRYPATEETVRQRLHYMKMAGREVFKHAVTNMSRAATDALRSSGLGTDDIRWIIPHQANLRIIEAIGERLGVGKDKVVVNLDRYGNSSAATIPLALDELYRQGKLQKHDKILMVAFGGGFTWGASVVEWDK
ncbi:MAG TPA: beta-ketoacyl-ACP synthase III [Kiritimatiellia bacterium]|nr:beta-ketoacyl-ACP synthase III [Kiritimatiellia bacterium]HRZ12146.1 beta-ketoacyl-ACP synthase III [Kiritimatiellia bacterium]HSA18096.1 beta-ketoacyl-ACP synthase III [Kiritimatiellia bacterium]